jgi:hypothetical protein
MNADKNKLCFLPLSAFIGVYRRLLSLVLVAAETAWR